MRKEIILTDRLKHKLYSFPETLLNYSFDFDENICENDLSFIDENQNPLDFQLSYIKKENGFLKSAKISFLSNLKFCDNKKFYLTNEVDKKTETDFWADINFYKCGGKIFKLKLNNIDFTAFLDYDTIDYRLLNSGSVYIEYEIKCGFCDGGIYTINLKFIKNMPFFELREKAEGINGKKSLMTMSVGFCPKYRRSFTRPEEHIDDYLTDDGFIPVTVMPYENWNPYFQSKYIQFRDADNKKCGLFIRDNQGWDNKQYPIWGSDIDFGIKFSSDMRWHFPILNGERFSGIAFDGEIEDLWLYYSLLHLDKVKDYVLYWNEDKKQYPLYFREKFSDNIDLKFSKGEPQNTLLTEIINKLSPTIKNIFDINPVGCREFADWTVIFDRSASEISDSEFDRVKAFFALMAYISIDENFMPTKNMLAGHPNFLMDVVSVAGFAAALFKKHPHVRLWLDYFNNAIKLNLKYHIRPDVKKWSAKGGRATENLPCYNFASLLPAIRVLLLLRNEKNLKNPLACDYGEKWLNWMCCSLSAPVNGRRIFPPQGAHASKFNDGFAEIPFIFYEFAKMLEKDYPKTSKKALSACENSPLVSFEFENSDNCPWRKLVDFSFNTEKCSLNSEKFTGYGYILRHNGKTEASIHIQQLDEGPNYRYGTFRNDGNGGIHYFAGNKRWSFNEAENTGDRNLGACEGSCNFGVLNEHTYFNIGFNDLSNPLIDFDFVKQVRLNGGENIHHLYKYRNVIMSGGEYIAVYDKVSDMRVRGRFSWFVNYEEEFPRIIQLKPGSVKKEYNVSGGADVIGDDGLFTKNPKLRSKGIGFDGNGDFLTVVSHIPEIKAQKLECGVKIILNDRTDILFSDQSKSLYKDDDIEFSGYFGIISKFNNGSIKAAVFEGGYIKFNGLLIKAGFCSLIIDNDRIYGEIYGGGELEASGRKKTCVGGNYSWMLLNNEIILNEIKDFYNYNENKDFVRDVRNHEFGFNGFDFRQVKKDLIYP